MNGVMLRRILNESWLPKGRKLRRELCLYLSFWWCKKKQETRYIGFYGWKYDWIQDWLDLQLSDLAFQGWLIHQCMHPCSRSNFKPTRQLTVIILISWHQWVTSSHKNIWCSWLVWDWCCSMSKVLFRFSYVYNTPGGHVMCTFSSSQY